MQRFGFELGKIARELNPQETNVINADTLLWNRHGLLFIPDTKRTASVVVAQSFLLQISGKSSSSGLPYPIASLFH